MGIGVLAFKVQRKQSVAGAWRADLAECPGAASEHARGAGRGAPPRTMRATCLAPPVAGLSLESQLLTALYLAVRLYCRCGCAAARPAAPRSPPPAARPSHARTHAYTARALARACTCVHGTAPLQRACPHTCLPAHLPARSFMMEYDVHTVLDFLTLVATGYVVYSMTGMADVARTYQREQDRVKWYYVVRARG